MIHSTYNNFGADTLTFRCRNGSDIAVINGKFTVDVENEDFLAADELEIGLDTELAIGDSLVSSCYMTHTYSDVAYGTALRCRIEDGNRLLIEKLADFEYKSEMTVYLVSAFVTKGGGRLLEVTPAEAIVPAKISSTYYLTVDRCAYRFEEGWGFAMMDFSTIRYKSGSDNVYPFDGFPTDVDVEVPAFLPATVVWQAYGTKALVLRFAQDGIHITSESGSGTGTFGGSVLMFYFVRGDSGEEDSADSQDGTEN